MGYNQSRGLIGEVFYWARRILRWIFNIFVAGIVLGVALGGVAMFLVLQNYPNLLLGVPEIQRRLDSLGYNPPPLPNARDVLQGCRLEIVQTGAFQDHRFRWELKDGYAEFSLAPEAGNMEAPFPTVATVRNELVTITANGPYAISAAPTDDPRVTAVTIQKRSGGEAAIAHFRCRTL